MAFFTWNDKYSVGVTELDLQHKQLIKILNELFDGMSAGKTNEILGKILAQLIAYTKTHFATEEKYMQVYGYPAIAEHKKEHESFANKVVAFQKDFSAGKLSLSLEVSTFLKNWLVQHISVNDKKYGPFFNSKGLK